MTDTSPRHICLIREEYISLFYFGHNVDVSLDFQMKNAFAPNHLTHLDVVRRRALESDYCVPWGHIALQPIGFHASLHI
jgi:hypothetical protein